MSSYLICQDEKKQSGNEVVQDLRPLRPLRPLHQVPRTRQATVGPALAVMVSLTLKSAMFLKVWETDKSTNIGMFVVLLLLLLELFFRLPQ